MADNTTDTPVTEKALTDLQVQKVLLAVQAHAEAAQAAKAAQATLTIATDARNALVEVILEAHGAPQGKIDLGRGVVVLGQQDAS